MIDIKSVEEIALFLQEQAHLRAPENDEAGILMDLSDEWVRRLKELDPVYYGDKNYSYDTQHDDIQASMTFGTEFKK